MRGRSACFELIVGLGTATIALFAVPVRAQESAVREKAPSLEERLQALEQKVAEIEARLDDQTAKSAESTTPAPAAASPIALRLLDKQFQEADPLAGQGSDRLVLTFELKSEFDQPLRAFTGTVVFKDVFGREVLRANLTDEDGLKPGQTVTWQGWIPCQQFDKNHQRLRNMEMKSLTFAFVLERVIYADGSTRAFAQGASGEKAVPLHKQAPPTQPVAGAGVPAPVREQAAKQAAEVAPAAAEPPKPPAQPAESAPEPAAPAAQPAQAEPAAP